MADIRPMNFGEILDGALMIYRRHFGLFLQVALVALSLPVVLLVYFGARFVGGFTTRTPDLGALLPLVPVVILYYLASLVLTAGTVRIISDSYLGRTPRLRDALALGFSKIWALAAVGLGKYLSITPSSMTSGDPWDAYFYDPSAQQAICLRGDQLPRADKDFHFLDAHN